MLSDILFRLRALLRRRAVESELDEELRFHFEHQVEKSLESGLPRAEALRRARLEFGGLDKIKEECREAQGVSLVENLVCDLGYAFRLLRTNPGFTAAAILSLALGIGANTAVFSIVNAVFLRPLPLPDADRLFLVHRADNRIGGVSISWPIFLAWQQKRQLFDSLGVVIFTGSRSLAQGSESTYVRTLAVTAGVFPALKVQPALGRVFREDDDPEGAAPAVILSDAAWRGLFASDPGILGRAITLNGRSCTVIGVMPREFELPVPNMRDTQVWLPYRPPPNSQNPGNGIWCIGRLLPGTTPARVESELTPALVSLSAQFPEMIFANERARLSPLRSFLNARAGSAPLLLFGAVGFVLLIACANVANLLLARASGRRREMSIRMALGAGRSRIMRQLLTESVLLALAGGLAGIAACQFSFDLILALVPSDLPRVGTIRIDAFVLGFALVLSLLTGIGFGMVPAMDASRSDLQRFMTEGSSRVGTSRERGRLRAALVVSEVSLALILLVGAALLIESLGRLLRVNPGFDPDKLLTVNVSLPRATYDTPAKSLAFLDNFARQLLLQPGVQQVGYINGLPLESQGDLLFSIEGRADDHMSKGDASIRAASPDYFSAMRIPVERGRCFATSDSASSEPVAVINRSLAARYWPDGSPLGSFVWVGKPMGPMWAEFRPRRIVGVVGDVHDESLAAPPGPYIYEPVAQQGNGSLKMNYVVRTAQAPLLLEPSVRNILRSQLPGQPVGAIRTMNQLISKTMANDRFHAVLLVLFGGIGLLIVTVGVYGVIAYFVAQHTHEIGVRIALGATRNTILRMVIGRGLRLAAAGVLVGSAASFFLTGLLRSMLFEVKPNDSATLIGTALALMVVAFAACWLPARHATRVDPMATLRHD